MNIQEAKDLTPQEHNILSEAEAADIKSRLSKGHRRTRADWDHINALLRARNIFTIRPLDEAVQSRFSREGVLYDKGVLHVFTDPEDCEEYAKRYAAVRMGMHYTIELMPFEDATRIADAHGKDIYINGRQERDQRYLVYDGKTKTLHLCINQQM